MSVVRRTMSSHMKQNLLDHRLAQFSRIPFRAKFHLREPERAFVDARGMEVVRQHAVELIDARLAPARPLKDGSQTPWGGHPVFRAQHATATCCRTCLRINHGIAKGHELTATERSYVVDIICRWIEVDHGSAPKGTRPPAPPSLF